MYPNLHLTRAAAQEILRNALRAAEISARNRQQSFTFMGAIFQFNWVNARDAYVTCRGQLAGIRIYDGVAVLD